MVSEWMRCLLNQSVRSITALAVVGSGTAAVANNVTARASGSIIVVRGDAAANEIVVSQNANRSLVVTGRNGTRVNGGNSFTSSRAFTHVEIFTGPGDDFVRLQSLNIAGDLDIRLGPGNNRLVGNSRNNVVGGDFDVFGGEQRDTVTLANWSVTRDMDVDLFNGPSLINIASTGVGGSLDVYGGDQVDTVTLSDLLVTLDVDVETYGSRDVINVNGLDARTLDIISGNGNDELDLRELVLSDDLDVLTGAGDDLVSMETVTAQRDIEVLLGSGNDVLAATGVTAFGELFLNGETGEQDTLFESGIEGIEELIVVGFETRN